MQYTIRDVPAALARALEIRAKRTGRSVNQLALEALAESVGQVPKRRNLRGMPGAWSKREAAELDRFLEEQHRINGRVRE